MKNDIHPDYHMINVKMTDGVFDSANCIAYEEAENRLHVQKAIMKALVG